MRKMLLSRFRLAFDAGPSCGAPSTNTALARAKPTQYRNSTPRPIRAAMNGTLSHAALLATGWVTQGYSSARPAKSTRNRTKETGRKPIVVEARRLMVGDQRPSVTWIIEAMAGPVMARLDQN